MGLEEGVGIPADTVATMDAGGEKSHELGMGNHPIASEIPERGWPCLEFLGCWSLFTGG